MQYFSSHSVLVDVNAHKLAGLFIFVGVALCWLGRCVITKFSSPRLKNVHTHTFLKTANTAKFPEVSVSFYLAIPGPSDSVGNGRLIGRHHDVTLLPQPL